MENHQPTHNAPFADRLTDRPTDRRALLAGIGGLAAGAFLASNANAGPLTPPPGPIASTPGPEPRIPINATNTPGDADSLFRISQPGSYYLTGNITGVTGKHGIEIAASGVTLDLNGFDLAGVPNMGAFDGIVTAANGLTNITVRNGSVRNWGGSGVNLMASSPNGTAVIEVLASGNGLRGIDVGSGSIAFRCAAYNNAGDGIRASDGSAVTDSRSFANGLVGINVELGSAISDCTAQFNSTGFALSLGSKISCCTAAFNTTDGIFASSGCTVTECTASSNNIGIRASNDCRIIQNLCDNNGNTTTGAGIRVTNTDNRIEGNSCTDNRIGIEVTAAGNFIARNTCSGSNLNWSIVPNNICLVVQSALAGVIVGNTGGVSPGSTDPNANYTF